MSASNPTPANPIQHFFYSLAKGLSTGLDPAPPPGTPTVGAPNVTTGTVTGSLGFPPGSGLIVTASQGSQGVVTVSSDGTYTYTPSQMARQQADLTTTDTFVATVHEGLSSSSVTVTVPVDPGTPLAGTPVVGVPDHSTGVVTGTAIFTDTAGRTLTYSTPGTSSGGATVVVDTVTGAYTYTPADGHGAAQGDSFTVTASNGVRSATMTITMPSAANRPPIITGWTGTTDPVTGRITGKINAYDPDGDTLSFAVKDGSYKWGSYSDPAALANLDLHADGTFTFAPPAGLFAGTMATFQIFVTDGYTGPGVSQQITLPTAKPSLTDPYHQITTLDGFGKIVSIKTGPDGKIYILQYQYTDVTEIENGTWTPTTIEADKGRSIVVIDPKNNNATTVIPIADGLLSVLPGENDNEQSRPGVLGFDVGLDGSIYVVDTTESAAQIQTNTVQRIDPSTLTCTLIYTKEVGNLWGGYNSVYAGPDGRVYLYGTGYNSGPSLAWIDLSDYSTHTYTSQINGAARLYGVRVSSRGQIYLGYSGSVRRGFGPAGIDILNHDGSVAASTRLTNPPRTGDDFLSGFVEASDGTIYVARNNELDEVNQDGTLGRIIVRGGFEPDGGALYIDDSGLAYTKEGGQIAIADTGKLQSTYFDIPGLTNDALALDYFTVSGDGAIYLGTRGVRTTRTIVDTPERTTDETTWSSSVTILGPGDQSAPPTRTTINTFSNPTSYLYQHLRDVTADGTHSVVVEKVRGTDNQNRLVVFIGGTTADVFGTNQSFVDNIYKVIAGSLDPDLIPTIDAAVAANPDLPIMLVGYSQGGIDAQNIAAAGRYSNVTAVVTYGTVVTKAPISGNTPPIPPDVAVLHLIDENDPISYYFSSPVTLAEEKANGQVFMGRSGVQPGDPNNFMPVTNFPLGYMNVHANPTTYDNVGMQFDGLDSSGNVDYTAIKHDLNDFRGAVLQTWQSDDFTAVNPGGF